MISTNIGSEGYSPKGKLGNNGKDGASIYYTSYSYENNKSEIKNHISNRNVLSNNPNYSSDSSVHYKNGDIIIDCDGLMLYIDNTLNGELTKIGQLIPKKDINDYEMPSNDDVSISFIASKYSNNTQGKYYNENASGYYRFHSRTLREEDLYVKLTYNTQQDASFLNDASMYKIIVILPSGHRISKVINSNTFNNNTFILIDYQLLFQLSDVDNNDGNIFTVQADEYSNATKNTYITNKIPLCKAYVEKYKKDETVKIYPINITTDIN